MNCCEGFTKFCLNQLGFVETIGIQEAHRRIENESSGWAPINRTEVWSGHSNNFTQYHHELLATTLQKFKDEQKEPGLAVDLGCGNSSPTLHLLQKGWKVIAVDNCPAAIENLRKTANEKGSNWLTEGQLTLVCQDIESYEFPQNVRLIMANNSLFFCNPAKIKRVWDAAHNSLEVGGRIIGNLLPRQILPGIDYLVRFSFSVWFTDTAVVRALLEDKKYQIERCSYGPPWYYLSKDIEFAGLKV
jgi:SAM-dependent methyltransferase